MWKIEKEDLYGGVANFNADPFCIEDEEVAEEVWNAINEAGGLVPITDEYDLSVARAQLDIPEDSDRPVFKAGNSVIFSPDDEGDVFDTSFHIGGKDYNYKLHICLADRHYEDENYARWDLMLSSSEFLSIEVILDSKKNGIYSGVVYYYDNLSDCLDDAPAETRDITLNRI